MKKTCTVCGETKPLEMFNKHSKCRLGRHSKCKVCRAKSNHDLYMNSPTYRASKNLSDKELRAYDRFRNYRITDEQYEQLFQSQNGCCAICGEEKRLVIDHDHDTRRIRGLLCQRCNTGLGKLGDSLEKLMRAVDYLKKGPASGLETSLARRSRRVRLPDGPPVLPS